MSHWQFHYPKRNAFYPPDYEAPGLGGSEAVLVVLTRALARRGHRVEVFNSCFKPGYYEGVRWRMSWELSEAASPDVAVAVRFEEALWPCNSEANCHLFWMLDDRPGGPNAFINRFGERGGRVVVASQAMQRRLDEAGIRAPTVLIPLPIETHRYRFDLPRATACLYSSMPNRGLDVLLDFWPRIRSQVPSAELWVTSGWQLWGFTKSEAEDRWRQVIGNQPLPEGVRLFGPVQRAELCRLQETAWLTLYPCRFPEMFCLVAAESAAAGTPLIASALDALVERVSHRQSGVLISGCIEREEVRDKFVFEAVALLTDPEQREKYACNAREKADLYSDDSVAATWERFGET